MVAAIATAAAIALAGCSSGGDFQDPGATNSSDDVVSQLASDLQPAYANLGQPVGATPYTGDWKPRGDAPWTIGYASPYDGNSWQAAAKARLFDDLLKTYQDAGLIKDVIITESGFDDSVQNQQIRQLVDQGADLIIACCSNTTSLNQSIEYAYKQGVPFVSYSGYVTSPYAINTSANYHQAGFASADAIFMKIGGEGTVLDVIGVAGAASSDSFDAGVAAAAANYPGIKLVGQVEGAWADTVTKTEVQKFLATNSEPIAGMIVQPGSATGALQALQESGRPIVPISIAGEAGALCYWIQNPDFVDVAFNVWPPGNEMQLGFEVAVRTLEGQGPKIQSIVREVSPITSEFALDKLGADCDVNSNAWIEPSVDDWFSTATLDKFFEDPSDPLAFKP
ncbi:hypothetical protein GCM10009655_12090 [Rhodoglobus aureus]|uniref:Periplasmic binding protein domain-containing protein n=2 Tax=Rhodoglobus aureus TaxID=191497 RepID=A0ABN1VNT4_9MICO